MSDKLTATLIEWQAAHDALSQLQEDWLDGKRDFTNTDESGKFMDRIAAADESLRAAMDGSGDTYAAGFRDGCLAMRERSAIRARIAQLEGKLADDEVRALPLPTANPPQP